jgi:hypothetical protein
MNSGTITTNGFGVSTPINQNQAGANVNLSGTWTGTVTFYCYSTNTVTSPCRAQNQSSGDIESTASSSGSWIVPNVGFIRVEARATAAVSGTIVVTINEAGTSGGGISSAVGGATSANQTSIISILNGLFPRILIGDAISDTQPGGLFLTKKGDTCASTAGISPGDADALCNLNGALGIVPVNFTTGEPLEPAFDAIFYEAMPLAGPLGALGYLSSLASTAIPTTGGTTPLLGDGRGRILQGPSCPNGNAISGIISNTDGNSTTVTGMGAQGANVGIEVTWMQYENLSATDITFLVRNGTAGSTLGTFNAANGSKYVVEPKPPMVTTADTALAVDTSAAVNTFRAAFRGCQVRQ